MTAGLSSRDHDQTDERFVIGLCYQEKIVLITDKRCSPIRLGARRPYRYLIVLGVPITKRFLKKLITRPNNNNNNNNKKKLSCFPVPVISSY